MLVAVGASAPIAAAAAGAFGSDYFPSGRCGPFARAQVSTPSWVCVGIVAGPEHGLIWPRSILQVAEDRFIVTDMVGWNARGRGKILSLTIDAEGRAQAKPIFSDRNLPHGLVLGPDGLVYVGDDDRIWRFDPNKAEPTPETVLPGLPDKRSRGGDHWHPLKHIVFDKDGNLIVNLGAPNDNCENVPGTSEPWVYPCAWSDGPEPDAALWQLKFDWPAGRPGEFTPLARGLRNSMAVAVYPPTGLLIQAENSIDKWNGRTDPDQPPDEINIIRPGGHYGWPYCVGFGTVMPEYRSKVRSCAAYRPAHMLLDAHAAPLGMIYYCGPMFAELNGKLLVALHGFAKNGHRIVAFDVDPQGRPLLPKGSSRSPPAPLALVDGWSHLPGVRPTGRPMALLAAKNGAIWFVDDKARTIMVLLRDHEPRLPAVATPSATPPRAAPPAPKGWALLYQTVLGPRCQGCHDAMRGSDPEAAWRKLVLEGLVDPRDLKGSPIVQRMLAEGPGRPMPLPAGLQAFPADVDRLNRFLESISPADRASP